MLARSLLVGAVAAIFAGRAAAGGGGGGPSPPTSTSAPTPEFALPPFGAPPSSPPTPEGQLPPPPPPPTQGELVTTAAPVVPPPTTSFPTTLSPTSTAPTSSSPTSSPTPGGCNDDADISGSGSPIDDGLTTQGSCGANAVCLGFGLSSVCACPAGYQTFSDQLASLGCADVDECGAFASQ
jgi:hypothetical protein